MHFFSPYSKDCPGRVPDWMNTRPGHSTPSRISRKMPGTRCRVYNPRYLPAPRRRMVGPLLHHLVPSAGNPESTVSGRPGGAGPPRIVRRGDRSIPHPFTGIWLFLFRRQERGRFASGPPGSRNDEIKCPNIERAGDGPLHHPAEGF